jgi:phytoene synthase
MIRGGSRSFFLASLFLPKSLREAAYAIYAFCRLSDDAVDVDGGQSAAIARLAARLDSIYAFNPSDQSVDRALSDAVRQFGIPRAALDALLEGLSWDVEGRSYETLSDVHDYAARVAGSVGALMATLMGARTPDLVARACDLGVAMQLTNIARDVGEDAAAGRLYLPRAWMREAGLDPDAWLARPYFCEEIASVTARLLRVADTLYARADAGIAGLDPAYRPAIFAARHLYAGIGERLERNGLDSISRRTRVPTLGKAPLLFAALQKAVRSPAGDLGAPPLLETRFLVEAVGREAPPSLAKAPRRRPGDDLAWTIDLLARLERRSRTGSLPQPTGALT